MGTSYTFRCNKCNYAVQTSGQFDYGMLNVTDTYICNTYKGIVDVLVGLRGKKFIKEEILVRKDEDDELDDFQFYLCPGCGSDEITEWDTIKKTCPKCDCKMGKDEDTMILWD